MYLQTHFKDLPLERQLLDEFVSREYYNNGFMICHGYKNIFITHAMCKKFSGYNFRYTRDVSLLLH